MTQLVPAKPEPDKFVPFTARLMAAMRAGETERTDRLNKRSFCSLPSWKRSIYFCRKIASGTRSCLYSSSYSLV